MTESSTNAMHNQDALDIMAQLNDPEWMRAAAKLEEEAGCDISAGPALGSKLGRMLADPEGFYQQQQLKEIVFQGLRRLLMDCDLGAGLTAAYSQGKLILAKRLQKPSIEIQQQLMAILDEDLSSSRDVPLPESAQASLKQVIQTVLSDEDWETISAAAAQSLQQHLKAVVCLPQTA